MRKFYMQKDNTKDLPLMPTEVWLKINEMIHAKKQARIEELELLLHIHECEVCKRVAFKKLRPCCYCCKPM